MKKEDERMLPLINQVLKAHGMSSFDELKAKLDAALTEEQKKKYKDVSALFFVLASDGMGAWRLSQTSRPSFAAL